MDKVKQYLALVRKHHFWILCGIAALTGLFAWYTSTKKLESQFQQDSQKVAGTMSALQEIRSPHANESWTTGIGHITQAARQDVKEAWQKLYQFQKEKIFIWPERLGKDFLDAIGNDRLPRDLRVRYQNIIKRPEDGEVARLAEIVDAPPPGATFPTQSNQQYEGPSGNTTVPAEQLREYRVSWPGIADLERWFDWYEPPSTQMIKFAQEELWVLQGLCNVIKAVNAGSTGAHDAPIKVIDEMAISYTASEDPAATSGRIQSVKSAAAPTEATGEGPPPGLGGSMEGGPTNKPNPTQRLKGGAGGGFVGGPDSGGAGAAAADPDEYWRNYRYVNDEGKPLSSTELAGGPAEYNLMPFRLVLQMDPRELDRLLVECRNSLLPIEVRQVRINAGTDRAGGAGTSYGRSSVGERPPTYAPYAGSAGQQANQSRLAHIEISGVIYLLRSPDIQRLGITPETSAPPADGAEPAESAAIVMPAAAFARAPSGPGKTVLEEKP